MSDTPVKSTIPALLTDQLRSDSQSIAYYFQRRGGPWQSITWQEFSGAVGSLAAALRATGIAKGERYGILSANCLEWEVAQHALLCCGASVVGLDVHHTTKTLEHLILSTGLRGLFVGDVSQARRLSAETLERLAFVVVFDQDLSSSNEEFTDLRAFTSTTTECDTASAQMSIAESAIGALVVFSSGTTGTPKPIEYTHGQVTIAVEQILRQFPDLRQDARLLCWLPLANLFQRMINFCAVARGIPSFLLENPQDVMSAVRHVNPELMLGVPRFFERVYSGAQAKLAESGPVSRAIGEWAFRVGSRFRLRGAAGDTPSVWSRFQFAIAERLVLCRVRAAFGTRVQYLISGSAPVSDNVHAFFQALGLPIYEAYGVSENVVPIAMNSPGFRRTGTVGRVLPANIVRVALDGEILVKGPGVFRGYIGTGDNSATPDAEGFWHTGDLGSLDNDGFLRISGRKSDAFKLSTGRWVSPVDVENAISTVPWVDHVVVLGAGRKATIAIVCSTRVKFESASGIGDGLLMKCVDDIRKATESLSAHSRPAGVLIVQTPFTIEGGELTPNLKIRRNAVEANFRSELSDLDGRISQFGRSIIREHGAPSGPVLLVKST